MRLLASLTALAAVLAGGWYWQRGVVLSQPAAAIDPGPVVSLRVRFGVMGQTPKAWDGSVTVTNGELVSLRNWHPRPGDKVTGRSWSLSTRRGVIFQLRAWDDDRLTPPDPYLLIPGVIVDIKASPGTVARFDTVQGRFEVTLRDLQPGTVTPFLRGEVGVDAVAFAQPLSTPEYENDAPAALAGPDGEIWTAWTAFRNGAQEILARCFDGHAWGPAQKVTTAPGDIFLVKLGRDKAGRVWAIWSAQVEGNFDLYARRFDGQSWSAVERLTNHPLPDVYHAVATDSNGNLWVAWQGFRNGKSDIFARYYDGQTWTAPEMVSTSRASDWEPAIAADALGNVYVAWDTYDQGNYDVMMRRWSKGEWDADPMAVASTPKYEAHVSLACDTRNRLWAAWNESGFEWGKDTGFLVKKQGTRLYQWRGVGVAVWDGKAWQEPAGDFNRDLRGYHDFPALSADGAGRVWLLARRRMLRIRDTPSDTPAHRAAWELIATTLVGSRWSAPLAVPFSQGRTDVRGGFAPAPQGGLIALWATDHRDFEEYLYQHSDVYAGRIPLPAPGAEPALRPRIVPALTAATLHGHEKEDLEAIRGYSLQSGGQNYRIYRGDTHRHTEFSMDGNNDGSLLQTYRYAIDAAELDFLGVSDHNGDGGPDVPYVSYLQQQMADVLMLPQRFTPLYAYERSLNYPNGHRNILFATRGVPTLPIPQAERQARIGAKPLYEYLKRYGGIAISHTSASNMGTDWRDNDPAVEPLVEIYQGDRVSAEYEGAPKAAWAGSAASAPGGFRPAGYVWNAWAKGYRLGVQSSSDHLSTHISYACTIATDFSRAGLLDAMRRRHSYGATDNIILDYRAQAGGKEYLQGDIVEAARDMKLTVRIVGTERVRQIDIIRNNSFIHTRSPLARDVNFEFVDTQPPAGESYYYVRVQQVDEQMAWSSPIWVRR